jgi:sugar/nucleoside kinase (ribokinase family)
MHHDGIRVLQPLQNASTWFGCFDAVQVNEDEMRQLSPDPLSLAASALAEGVSLLAVTLGPRGAAYVAAPGFDGWTGAPRSLTGRPADSLTAPVRTALVAAPAVDAVDPTGCGDVFGASLAARLVAGDAVEPALRHANAMAARNATFRGAGGLARHLRGELLTASAGAR